MKEDEMSGMKPCPFCGKEPQEITLNGEPKVVCRCLVREPNIWNTRPIEDDLRKRIAELEGAYIKADDMLDDVILERAIEIGGLKKRIAELEEQVWNLNLENERLEEAYWIDESIAPDGTLKPCVRKLLERLEKAETDLRLSDDLVKALDNRIAELTECIGSQMADVYTLKARIAELSQAVGLITTLKPTMVMDVDHPLEMAKEVAEYVTARIAELEEKQRWIPVSERLPEFGTSILFYDSILERTNKGTCTALNRDKTNLQWLTDDGIYYHGNRCEYITHWKEEPELPEVQE